MVAKLVALLFLGSIFTSLYPSNSKEKEISRRDRLTDRAAYIIGQQVAEKHRLKFAGIGGGADKGERWLMTICFEYRGKSLLKDEARKLIVECTEEFLQIVNSNDEIRPYLRDYPFTENNLEFVIVFLSENGKTFISPYISSLSQFNGKISYTTKNSHNIYDHNPSEWESYEIASKHVEQENGG